MPAIVRETALITFWTFWLSVIVGAGSSLMLKWPLTATYMMAVLTIGPALAIWRGKNRETDPLEVGERAGAEMLALIILMAIGWAAGHYLGR